MSDISSISINNTTYDLKDKNAIHTSGGTLLNTLNIASIGDTSAPIQILNTNNNVIGGIFQFYNTGRLCLGQTTPDASTSFGNGERYLLPTPTDHSSVTYYHILTSKNPVTIAQGGTSATTAANAWTNLGGGSIGKKNSLVADDIPELNTSKITAGILPKERGGTGNATGLAASATKLATARGLWVRLNLDYDADNLVTFDGTANKGIPVYSTLNIDHGGTGAATASDALDNLGGVAKSGDTMTGNLVISNATLHIKKPSADISASSISANQYATFGAIDKNNRYIGYIQPVNYTSGMTAIQVTARKYINNANVENNLTLRVDASGNKSVTVSDSKIWRNALGASSGVWPTSVGGTGGTDSDWKSYTNSNVFTGTIYYRKIGYFGEIYAYAIKLNSDLTTDSGISLGSINSDYAPSKSFMQVFGSSYTSGLINVSDAGAIKLYKDRNISSLKSTWTIYWNVMYLL